MKETQAIIVHIIMINKVVKGLWLLKLKRANYKIKEILNLKEKKTGNCKRKINMSWTKIQQTMMAMKVRINLTKEVIAMTFPV